MEFFQKRLTIYLITIYFSLVSYGGIIAKLLLNFNIQIIKKILPELVLISLIVIVAVIIFQKGLIVRKGIVIPVIFFSIQAILKLNNVTAFDQIIYSLRDIWLPFFFLIFITNFRFEKRDNNKLISTLNVLFIIVVISGFILGIIELVKGLEWTSNFYTGKVFIGIDYDTGIKIDIYKNTLRVPSISGNSVTFALINFFGFFVFLLNKEFFDSNKIIYYIKQAICILNIFMSTSRTSILMLAVLIILMVSRKRIISLLLIVVSVSLFFCFDITNIDTSNYMLLSNDSINQRINTVWKEVLVDTNIEDFFAGEDLYSIGNGLQNKRAMTEKQMYSISIDNVYIYIFLSYGVFGILAYFMILKELCKIVKQNNNEMVYKIFIYYTAAIVIGGFFVNILQGRTFTLYLLTLSPILYKNDENKLLKIE